MDYFIRKEYTISRITEEKIMELADKIRIIRKARGYSQEQLGDKLSRTSENGISRQAVSDWENGRTEPKLDNIRDLATVLNVSYDALLDESIDLEEPKILSKILGNSEEVASKTWSFHFPLKYEYVSKIKIFNIPLVHINVGLGLYRAKGIIAIGNIATGFLSLGLVSIGLLSVGVLALGLLSLGAFSFGLLAFGAIALGLLSFGGISLGYFTFGGLSVGKYAIGGYAHGTSISYGGRASGGCPFDTQNGDVVFTKEEIKNLIELYANSVPDFIKKIFISLGK